MTCRKNNKLCAFNKSSRRLRIKASYQKKDSGTDSRPRFICIQKVITGIYAQLVDVLKAGLWHMLLQRNWGAESQY